MVHATLYRVGHQEPRRLDATGLMGLRLARQQSVEQDKIPSPVRSVVAFPTQHGQGHGSRSGTLLIHTPFPYHRLRGKGSTRSRTEVVCAAQNWVCC